MTTLNLIGVICNHNFNKMLQCNTNIDKLNCTLGDFWSWAYSDILNNRNRGIFAEFMVMKLLKLDAGERIEWDNCDTEYCNSHIEIKCSAYLQSWDQKGFTNIIYDISKKCSWDEAAGKRSQKPIRFSDLFIFCLLKEKDKEKINVLDLEQWEFYVVRTLDINNKYGDQKKISLIKIKELANAITYSTLKKEVDNLLK